MAAWFKKMDFITSRESLRINLIAIYTLLPHFTTEMVGKWFSEIGRLTFSQLDNYMYLKLTNSSCRFHSPSKMQKDNCTFPYGGTGLLHNNKNVRLGIQYAEKMSQRLDQLKQQDPLLEYDLVEVFRSNLSALVQHLGGTIEQLEQFLSKGEEPHEKQMREQFKLLITSQCTRQQ